MDRSGWPWKKKASNKTGTQKALTADPTISSLASVAACEDQGNCKSVNYAQIPSNSYTHLTHLEDEVKKWQSRAKDFEEQLSAAKLDIISKDNLATQHSKVAEEAVTGWEKADAEASELKNQLESVALLKLSAEDRVYQLEGALKECSRQLRVAKEEHHEEMNEMILTKDKQCGKIKTDLEAKIADFEQRLHRSSAENAALSRSLQEYSSMLMKINDEKCQADNEKELLKRDIQSREKEINSLKYEVHVVSKELDIRNEEKNMSARSAEAATKQLSDSTKKVSKLEAECQRLRALVKKKLPGPAALAQMKLEVENWSNDFGESRSVPNKPLSRSTRSQSPSLSDINDDNIRPDHKEIELLMKRLLGTEEETKMLKEILSVRNSELQSSRDSCSKMVFKIKNLETQVQILNQLKNSPRSIFESPTSGPSSNASNPRSTTSLSEDGLDDDGRYSKSSTISDLSIIKEDKLRSRSNNSVADTSIDIMDDFLEMERIAHSKNNSEYSSVTGTAYQRTPHECIAIPFSDSNHEVPADGNLALSIASCKCLMEIEQLKVEKSDMTKELVTLSRDLESKKLQLEKLDLQLTEAKLELASSRKWSRLAETQVKCMAESYKLLETRVQELDANVISLQEKSETLEAMLEEEKRGHEEALARSKDLQDQIHRKESCQACSSLAADSDVKSKKEREIADASAKLAECQETIFLLGKQLKALHHPTKHNESQYKEKLQTNETIAKYKLSQSFRSPQSKGYSHDFGNIAVERASSFDMRSVLDGPPIHSYENSSSPSSGELSQKGNKSCSSSSELVSKEEQNSFTRFVLLSKGKH